MGDIVSLVEKAQEVFDEEQAIKMQQKMAKNTFDLQDYLEQLESMNKMGGLESMLELIPGMKGQVTEDDIDKREIEREKAIIRSMTYAERRKLSYTWANQKAKGRQGKRHAHQRCESPDQEV